MAQRLRADFLADRRAIMRARFLVQDRSVGVAGRAGVAAAEVSF
jgi:hypothetical protein